MNQTSHEALRKPRLFVVVTHPIQYYAPLYRCLAERGGVDIKVIYLSDAGAVGHEDEGFSHKVQWDVPLLAGYDFQVLQPGSPITTRRFWTRHDDRLTSVLNRESPDWLLLYGYASRMNWVAAHWARRHRVNVMYSSDSNIRDPKRRRFALAKRLALGYYFRLVDSFLATSEANAEYLLKFGADHRKVQRVPFAIDVQRFRRAADAPIDQPRRYDFVWAGKFIALKRASDFIQALQSIARRSTRTIRACIVGDGPGRATLESLAHRLPENCIVEFLGFTNQQQMPVALQAAETLVFTSEHEPYGLIASEAAAAGLALIVADNIGCVSDTDVARPEVNALTYKVGNIPALAELMERMMDDAGLRLRMQQASVDIAEKHDLSHAAEVIERIAGRKMRDA
jgi:glycosyltransferase involved in cell wall biosynthesis